MNSLPPSNSRRSGSGSSMFLRMLVRAAMVRRGRAASALLAMIVAATAATAMLNLYVDVQAKLRGEFRRYGANVVVVAKGGASLPAHPLATVDSCLHGQGLAVPFAYAVARTADGHSVVAVGTDFARARRLNNWWFVTAWPQAAGQALLGTRAAAAVAASGHAFDLTFQGKPIHLTSAGTLQTGAAEDSRIYLSLAEFEQWTGLQPSAIEIAVSGDPAEVESAIQKLAQALPAAEVRPVRQIVEGEARVLGKTKATLLTAAILIVLTSALCVLVTLTGWVFDRRRDFAVMKALGASQRLIGGFFAAEAAALGAAGAIAGFSLGVGVAAWIGRANFHAPVAPRLSLLPFVFAGSIGVALLAAILPLSLLRRVQPAMILRGE